MSTQRGNATRHRGQKHQNSYSFQVKKKVSPLEAKILETPTSNFLCATCQGVIQWKKQFKKYKPLTVPRRWYCGCFFVSLHCFNFYFSASCHEKTITFAYMVHCEACAEKLDICAKCSCKNLSETLFPFSPSVDLLRSPLFNPHNLQKAASSSSTTASKEKGFVWMRTRCTGNDSRRNCSSFPGICKRLAFFSSSF